MQVLASQFSQPTIKKLVKKETRIDKVIVKKGAIPKCYDKMLQLPFNMIFTTNWDTISERVWEKHVRKELRRPKMDVIIKDDHVLTLRQSKRPYIVKLHGDIGKGRRILITADDVARHEEENPCLATILKHAFLTHTLLFIGYSFQDPDLKRYLSLYQLQAIDARKCHNRPFILSVSGRRDELRVWRAHHLRVIPLAHPEQRPTKFEVSELEKPREFLEKLKQRTDDVSVYILTSL